MARPLLLVWSMARACLHQAKQTGQEQRTLLHDNEGFPEGARTSMANERIEEGLCELQKFVVRTDPLRSARLKFYQDACLRSSRKLREMQRSSAASMRTINSSSLSDSRYSMVAIVPARLSIVLGT